MSNFFLFNKGRLLFLLYRLMSLSRLTLSQTLTHEPNTFDRTSLLRNAPPPKATTALLVLRILSVIFSA